MKGARKIMATRSIQLRRSGVHGYGLFARDFVPQGERVIEYVGERITKAASAARGGWGWVRLYFRIKSTVRY